MSHLFYYNNSINQNLESTYGKIRILKEKTTGGARVDAVMITPTLLCGIEIKSDADTYTKLKSQEKLIDECKISILRRRELNNLLAKNKLPQI